VGDGAKKTLSYTKADGSTLAWTPTWARHRRHKLKRFLVGPKACEITGLCETPDGKAVFINIQHPGEGTLLADIATRPSTPASGQATPVTAPASARARPPS
jgi:secreted PhoX family phosphatase